MAQVLGRGRLFLDGDLLATVEGGTIDTGGEVRETVQGQFGPLGYKVTSVAPGAVEADVAVTADLKISGLDLVGATVLYVSDIGKAFLIVQANRVGDPLQVNVDDGTVSVRYEGQVSTEI